MKWRLRTIAVFLLGGAVINIAVAWGCALSSRLDYGDLVGRTCTSSLTSPAWHFTAYQKPGYRSVTVGYIPRNVDWAVPEGEPRLALRELVPPSWLERIDGPGLGLKIHTARFDTYGWPARSLLSGCLIILDDTWTATYFFGSIPLAPFPPDPDYAEWYFEPRSLPVRPMWSAFLVNVAFYAGFLWLGVQGPLMVFRFARQRKRRKAGACPACGYPRGQSPVCTECGAALPREAYGKVY